MSRIDDTGAETRAELVASRARILAGADESRRRLQRELHDGAQQRLVHAVIALKMARGAADPDSPGAGLVAEALTNVEQASRDLRAVVHRLLPRSLTYGGLGTGLQSLVDDLSVPVDLRVSTPRLEPELETTAYLVVAEGVGALERAGADRVDVDVGLDGDILTLEIRCAGTDAGRDPDDGLTGVRDRVQTAGGSLAVTGAPGADTAVRVRLPVGTGVGAAAEDGARRV